MIRRSLDGKEVWYYVSNAEEETPWQTLAMVTGTRIRVEEYFQDGKTHLGMQELLRLGFSLEWPVGGDNVFAVGQAGTLENQSATVADVVLGELCGGRREIT